MSRRLAAAIIASFQDVDKNTHYALISSFNDRDWTGTYKWLDASGLGLYFLARLKSLQIENAIPVKALQRLEKNASDNRDRTADMFGEFIRINKIFQSAEISYVNIKGFTLAPDVCPDLALRSQFDLDFAVAFRDIQKCAQILRQQGYWLTGAGSTVQEFKAGSGNCHRYKIFISQAHSAVSKYIFPT